MSHATEKMFTSWILRSNLKCLVGVMISLQAGCSILPSHLHNDANSTAAAQLDSDVATFAQNAPGVYAAMLDNLGKYQIEEDKIVSDFAANHFDAWTTESVTMPGSRWQKEIEAAQQYVDKFDADVQIRVKNDLAAKNVNVVGLNSAKSAVDAANQLIDQQRSKVAAWNGLVAVFRDGLSALPQEEKSSSSVQKIDQLAKNALATTVEFEDSSGQKVSKSIKDILQDAAANSIVSIKQSSLNLNAPGADLAILEMGLELAENERELAQTRLSQLEVRAAIYNDAALSIAVSKLLLTLPQGSIIQDDETVAKLILAQWADASAEQHMLQSTSNDVLVANQKLVTARKDLADAQKDGSVQPSPQAIATLKDSESQALAQIKMLKATVASQSDALLRDSDTIAGYLKTVRLVALARAISIRDQSLFSLQMARLDHMDSILESRADDARWAALHRGAAGVLKVYHAGGITKDDVATILQIAQQAALWSIATKVN